MNKTKIIVGAVVIAVVFFAGGYFLAGSSAKTSGRSGAYGAGAAGFARGMGTTTGAGGMGGRAGANFTGGTVIAKDTQSITVQAQTGGSKIVFVSGSTQVSKTVSGTLDDVSIGTSVTITSTQNPDGSFTAQMVQVRPARPATTTPAQ